MHRPVRPADRGRRGPGGYGDGVSQQVPPASQTAILDAIRSSRTVSRVELTRATGLTPATVSIVVRRLIDSGLVVEVGRGDSTGGKPRTLLELAPTSRYAVGAHLDEDGTTYVVVDLGGAVVARWRRRGIGDGDPHVTVARIASEVQGIVERAAIDPARLVGLGVVSAGPLVLGTGRVLAPPAMAHWVDFPLRERLEDATGLPVLLDNDATASVVGSYWAERVPDTVAMAALFVGSGIGAGILTDGTVYRGARGNAGEVGHTTVDLDGPECWCGNRGCLEVMAGPATVVAQARAAGFDLGPADRPVLTAFHDLARRALAGDQPATALLTRSARYVAVGAHTLANILDLDLLVLTGPALAVAGPVYLPVVARHLAEAFFARGSGSVDVRLSAHGAEAAAIGAAALALQSGLAPRSRG